MFAANVTRVIRVKNGEEDVDITIRKLSGRSLSRASELRQEMAAKATRMLGGDVLRAFRDSIQTAVEDADSSGVKTEEKKPEQPSLEDRKKSLYATYNREYVLQAGIVKWSLENVPLSKIEDLDEETSELLFHAIIDLSVKLPEEKEEALGKD